MMNTAVEDERIARNPCRIRRAGIEKAPERPLVDMDLVLDLAAAIEPHLRALVLLAGFVGLRTGELLGLRRCDVDVAQHWIHVAGERSGRPLTRSRLSASWLAACGAPPGLRIHDVRHHAATLTARMPGITTKELMARIGHSSPRAALIYQHATEERDRVIADYLDNAVSGARRTGRAILAPSDQSET
jgi:integrase